MFFFVDHLFFSWFVFSFSAVLSVSFLTLLQEHRSLRRQPGVGKDLASRVAIVAVFVQHISQEVFALRTDGPLDVPVELESVVDDAVVELRFGRVLGSFKRMFTCHYAEQNDAQAPNVRLEVVWLLQ